jgi:hypothetical protein
MRTIQHPDVEIREIDQSQIAPAIAGTTCLVAGFSDRGEENEPFEFTSRNAFLNYFGQPTNEAEYYFYHAANEIIQQNGGLVAARIPYNNDGAGTFMSKIYTAGGSANITTTDLGALSAEGLSSYKPITPALSSLKIPVATVDSYRTGTKPTANTIVVIDKIRDNLKKSSTGDEFGGIFTAIVTPWNAIANQSLATFSTPSAPYSGWNVLANICDQDGDPLTTGDGFVTPISGDFRKASLSKTLGGMFPALTFDQNNNFDEYMLHQVMLVVGRTYEDSNNDNKIGVQILESFLGSLNPAAIDGSNGESIFLDYIVNNNSDYVEVYSNLTTGLANGDQTYVTSAVNSNLLSYAEADYTKTIELTGITNGLTTIFDKTSNIDEREIDIVVDAGISTIANYIGQQDEDDGLYDPTTYVATTDTISAREKVDDWKTIANKYIEFCKDTRKDCMTIIDGPRNLVLQGNEKIERASAPNQLIDIDVIPKLKYVSGLNSSYGAGYVMWNRIINEFTGQPTWVPPSCKAAGVYVYTDRVANFWDAPAGLNRAVLYGVTDIAFNPKPGQMDSLYNKAWNYARNYPLDGIVLEGQKTLQVRPSAFDRVNVRRLFLRLERSAYQVLRYFMYEPNNYFTRTQIIDVLTPVFEAVKIRGGLYDYKIVCNESNNTPEVVDRNELKIAIMLKPTKTSEFILADFYALTTGASFSEVIL